MTLVKIVGWGVLTWIIFAVLVAERPKPTADQLFGYTPTQQVGDECP